MRNFSREALQGAWIEQNGSIVADQAELEIDRLLHDELRKIAASNDGWDGLYFDPSDKSYWELTYPKSQMHGGGPKRLTPVSLAFAQKKYRI